MHLFRQETGRDVKFAQFLDLFRDYADLLFEFANRADPRIFTSIQRPGRDLKQKVARSVPILPDECDRGIVEHRNDHGAAFMLYNFALVCDAVLANLVLDEVDDFSFVNSFGGEDFWFHVQFVWSVLVLIVTESFRATCERPAKYVFAI